jgi:integrase
MNKLEDFKTYLINLQQSTVYFNYMKKVFDYLEEKNIKFEELNKEQLADLFSRYKANSINLFINSGKAYCRFLEIDAHVFFTMKTLKPEKRLATYLTIDEIEKAVRQIATYNSRLNSSKAEIVILVMFYLGLRKSEIINLKREAFDLVNSKVNIYAEKTKEEKLLPFPEKLLKKLIAYFNSEAETINAFNITEAEINYLFRKVLTKHLGRLISPHQARHGAGRFMAECGINPNVIQRMLGHKDIQTTMNYIMPSQADMERIYKEKIK